MPHKFFQQRYSGRYLDTISGFSDAGSNSFFTTASRTAATNPPATEWDYTSASVAPSVSATGGKVSLRKDCALITDFKIPTASKILGGYIALTVSSIAVAYSSLDIAFYPENTPSDVLRYRGAKSNSGFAWSHVPIPPDGVIAGISPNWRATNFWFKLNDSVPTVLAQTSCAAAAAATQGSCIFGRMVTDAFVGTTSNYRNGYGNAVQIDSSGSVQTVLTRVGRSGTFGGTVNLVCNVYEYDSNTRSIGALRATSAVVDASTITTSGATTETTFTFGSSFSVTAGEYVFVSIEPQTNFNTSDTAYLISYFPLGYADGASGDNSSTSEELAWYLVRPTGNAMDNLSNGTFPVLYSGTSGTTIYWRPYLNVVDTLRFVKPPSGTAGEVVIMPLSMKLLRALEQYNRDKRIYYGDGAGLWISINVGNNAGGAINFSNAITAVNGIYLNYRSTRTFIT